MCSSTKTLDSCSWLFYSVSFSHPLSDCHLSFPFLSLLVLVSTEPSLLFLSCLFSRPFAIYPLTSTLPTGSSQFPALSKINTSQRGLKTCVNMVLHCLYVHITLSTLSHLLHFHELPSVRSSCPLSSLSAPHSCSNPTSLSRSLYILYATQASGLWERGEPSRVQTMSNKAGHILALAICITSWKPAHSTPCINQNHYTNV